MKIKMNILTACALIFMFAKVPASQAQYAPESLVNSWSIGGQIKTNGYGAFVQRRVKLNRLEEMQIYTLDLSTFKHPREIKIVNQSAQNPTPYVFGKKYHTFTAALTTGLNRELIKRGAGNRIGVDALLEVGAVLGILRPVYLDVMQFRSNDLPPVIVSEKYNSTKHTNQSDIVGYSRESDGWGDLLYSPGLRLRPSFSMAWGNYSNHIKRFNVGVNIDYFPGKLPIMALGENPNLYVLPFVSASWGFGAM